jgi:hypothetical protein
MSTEPEIPEVEIEILPNTTKVEFDPQQQALVDRLIRESQGKAAADVRRQLAEKTKELELLRTKTVGESADASTIEVLRASIADEKLRADRAVQQADAQTKQAYQSRMSNQFSLIDETSATKLLQNNLRFDEQLKTFVATDDNGVTRLNSDGTPMTGDKLYEEFANAKPHFVKGQVKSGGGGSSSTGHLPPTDQYKVETLWGPNARADSGKFLNAWSLRDKLSYDRARRSAVQKGLI